MPNKVGGGDTRRIVAGLIAGLGALGAGMAIIVPEDARLYLLVAAAGVSLVATVLMLWPARRSSAAGLVATLSNVLVRVNSARVVTDRDGKVLFANSEAKDWLRGDGPLQVIDQRVVAGEEGQEAVNRLQLAIQAGAPLEAEIVLEGRGDEPEWLQVSLTALPEGLMLWRLNDITARRTIEDVLNQERQTLADFLHFMPIGVYSADIDGVITFANHRFAEWMAAKPEDLSGARLEELIIGSARPQADGEWQGEVQFKSRAGEIFTALVLQSTYDDAGVTRTRTLAVRDGVMREQSTSPGRVAYERFRVLFNAAPVAIAITDPDGIVVDCNAAFEELAHQSRAGVIGGALAERLLADDRKVFASELGKVLSGESAGVHLDTRVQGRAVVQATVYLGPLTAPLAGGTAEIEGAVVHFIDTTEQRNLEAQFAQAQKMQAMGQLAGGVAHDFNNLLTAMIGFCDLLLQRHAAGDPSFADIMQIKQNANRAASLVRQLLAFSRKQPLQPRNLNPTDAITELSHLLTRLIGESIEFKLVHGRDIGVVKVDPGQFDQMIINLAVNARDAMPGGGTLTITTTAVTFDKPPQLGAEQLAAGRYVRIEVGDSGTGIAPEHLARIFEPFFSTKKEVPGAGTGLGLATVYGIVRQTGGFIQVESSLGKGAKFIIHLPRYAPEADEAEAAATKKSNKSNGADSSSEPPKDLAGHGTILLVEDEDAVRVFAARALKNKGYKVVEARTGEQALDILRDQPAVDLMITDMMMPGMDGGTLARLIRVERPEIRIILISGYSEEIARGEVATGQDFHFLPKPFSLGQLATKVKDVMEEGV
ncbi:MAG: PAS domain-containing sensor histidine kinase [Rhodospirillaceae bacterium]|nr:PAS domain-containing sensor histidine kinase [Rhodospirillaceae bacterium]